MKYTHHIVKKTSALLFSKWSIIFVIKCLVKIPTHTKAEKDIKTLDIILPWNYFERYFILTISLKRLNMKLLHKVNNNFM